MAKCLILLDRDGSPVEVFVGYTRKELLALYAKDVARQAGISHNNALKIVEKTYTVLAGVHVTIK